MKVYSNLVFDVQNKIRCLPFPGQNITDNTIQLQDIYGRHSAVLSLFSYRVPPNYKRPIVKCDVNNEDNKVSILQRNIMKFSFCFASFFLSRSHGDQQMMMMMMIIMIIIIIMMIIIIIIITIIIIVIIIIITITKIRRRRRRRRRRIRRLR